MKRKTTLMLEEEVYDAVRMEAARRRMSMSDVVAEAAAKYFAEARDAKTSRTKFRLPAPARVGNRIDLPPDVHTESASDLMDYLDRLDGPSAEEPSVW
jgi:hypothetical protein